MNLNSDDQTDVVCKDLFDCHEQRAYGYLYSLDGAVECVNFYSDVLRPGWHFAPSFSNDKLMINDDSRAHAVEVHYSLRPSNLDLNGRPYPYVSHIRIVGDSMLYKNETPWSPDRT